MLFFLVLHSFWSTVTISKLISWQALIVGDKLSMQETEPDVVETEKLGLGPDVNDTAFFINLALLKKGYVLLRLRHSEQQKLAAANNTLKLFSFFKGGAWGMNLLQPSKRLPGRDLYQHHLGCAKTGHPASFAHAATQACELCFRR